jgi:UDP-N-acetylmuramate dehydrogenase
VILSPRQIEEIRGIVHGHVLTDVLLSRFTSFKIGGPADLVVEPADAACLAEVLRYLADEGIPRMVLGAGTNVLFRDRGFRGVVIRTAPLTSLEFREDGSGTVTIDVAAGVPLPGVVSRACKLGWTGLEWLWGIPGSFGGAVVTNAGAGGVSVADRLVRVKLLTERGEETILKKTDLIYGYRFMKLPPSTVVATATLELVAASAQTVQDNLEAARAKRRGQQPWDKPSAGCVFKNPSPDNPAGAIVDRLGFKGTAVGDAQVSEVHANFIINRGNARAADVLELIEIVRSTVKEKEHIDLELEILVLGEEASHD